MNENQIVTNKNENTKFFCYFVFSVFVQQK